MDAKIETMTDDRKNHILDIHNKYRSKIASGHQEPFPEAAHMQTLVNYSI